MHTRSHRCSNASTKLPFVLPREGSMDDSGIFLIRVFLSGMDWSIGKEITGNGTRAQDHRNDSENNQMRHQNLLHSIGFWRILAAEAEGTFACQQRAQQHKGICCDGNETKPSDVSLWHKLWIVVHSLLRKQQRNIGWSWIGSNQPSSIRILQGFN